MIAGEACALIHDIPPAGVIVERIVAEAERLLRMAGGTATIARPPPELAP